MKKDYSNELGIRFKIRYDELKWLYYELYHDDKQGFDYLCKLIKQYYTERDEALKKRDREREQDTYWYRGNDIVGMMLYVDNFADNLNGVIKNIDYFTESGVNYIHLMPLLDSPEENSDGGYAVSDFRKIQPKLGTMENLQKLTALCHERGINCCLDFVMNHTSDEHEWAKAARQGDPDARSHYFFFDSWETPNEYERTVPQVFPTTAPGNFTQLESGEIVMTTFYPYQWDLNYANPMVFNDMTANMLFLANAGIDVIRLDAVPYIWKELGTSCRNLPQVHNIVRMMRIICEIVCPSVLLLGEVVMEPSMVAPYFGTEEKPECHILYNVTTMASIWNTYATRDVRLLRKQIDKVSELPPNCVFLNYLRCHDDIGWGLDYGFLAGLGQQEVPHKKFLNDYFTGKWPDSPARGELYNDDPRLGDARLCGTTDSLCGIQAARENEADLTLAVRWDKMLHALMFTLSGIRVLYSGDEIGMENDAAYHLDPMKAEDSRWLHRGNMDWQKAALRREPDTVENDLFSAIKLQEALRAAHVAFDGRADAWLLNTGNDHVLGIGRYYQGEKLLALFNFTDVEQTVVLEDTSVYTDLCRGDRMTARVLHLKSGGFLWLQQMVQ